MALRPWEQTELLKPAGSWKTCDRQTSSWGYFLPLWEKTHSQLVLPKPEKLEPIVLYQYYFLYIVSIYGSRKGKWGERETTK